MSADQLRLIEDCHVTQSSGCHRYDFWNEQSLFDGRSDTGWCPPSRTEPLVEFLEIDLGRARVPNRIRIQRRADPKIATGFPVKLRLIAYPTQGAETVILSQEDVTVAAGQWWECDLERVETAHIRLEAHNTERRPNGSYVIQFMQLQILEKLDL